MFYHFLKPSRYSHPLVSWQSVSQLYFTLLQEKCFVLSELIRQQCYLMFPWGLVLGKLDASSCIHLYQMPLQLTFFFQTSKILEFVILHYREISLYFNILSHCHCF